MIITEKQKEFVKRNVKKGEELLKEENLNMILDELYDLSVESLDKHDEATNRTFEIERIMDDIYYQNYGDNDE